MNKINDFTLIEEISSSSSDCMLTQFCALLIIVIIMSLSTKYIALFILQVNVLSSQCNRTWNVDREVNSFEKL